MRAASSIALWAMLWWMILLAPASAQLKPHEKGNCFHWQRCRGDSIGNTIIESAYYCATIGGKSWMREDGLCVSFPGGPQAYDPSTYRHEDGGEPWPGRRY